MELKKVRKKTQDKSLPVGMQGGTVTVTLKVLTDESLICVFFMLHTGMRVAC